MCAARRSGCGGPILSVNIASLDLLKRKFRPVPVVSFRDAVRHD